MLLARRADAQGGDRGGHQYTEKHGNQAWGCRAGRKAAEKEKNRKGPTGRCATSPLH